MIKTCRMASLWLAATMLTACGATTDIRPSSSAAETAHGTLENETRSRILFVDDWKFQLGDDVSASQADFDDEAWRPLSLPHDWSIEGEYREDHPAGRRGGYLPGGIGWYRKRFEYDPTWDDKSVRLTFDGIYMNATIFVNGVEKAHQPYGYIGFTIDLSDDLKPGENIISVRVDNEKLPSGRWYTGSGIYRDVWLTVTDPVHVVEDGSYYTTPVVTEELAQITAQHEIKATGSLSGEVKATLDVMSPDGIIVASAEQTVALLSDAITLVEHNLSIAQPDRWSPSNPALYTGVMSLHDDQGRLLDRYETRIGLRSIDFTVDRGFLINGQPLEIQGMCMHHDGGAVGAAVPHDVLRHRLQLLKDAGVNAIRTAHNPFAPEFYDMADEMGFLLMDEAFDGWETEKAEFDYGLYFEEWWERDLTRFIRRDRNHPSVILWSVGNEVKDATAETQKALIDHIKALDETRPVTQGRGYWLPHADIAGFNGHGEYLNGIADFHAENPDIPVIGTEITHTLHTRGIYRSKTEIRERDIVNPKFTGEAANKRWLKMKDKVYPVPDLTEEEAWPREDRWYASSFDNNIVRMPIREEIKLARELPYLLGTFRWTAFDYLGESRGWPARTTNFGVIDLADLPKDPYYLYKSQWTNAPMVHVSPHWTHPGKEGVEMPIVVWTNLDRAELFVNGVSMGEKPMTDDLQIVWTVPYEPGDIRVVARDDEGHEEVMSYVTAGEPARMNITQNRDSLSADNRSVARLEIDIVDEMGTLVPQADNKISIAVSGSGRLIGIENGDILDLSSSKGTERKAFNGKLVALVQATYETSPINITVSADGLPESVITLPVLAPLD